MIHVRLNTGGTVSLTVNNVQLTAMSKKDRDFVIDLIDRVSGYIEHDDPVREELVHSVAEDLKGMASHTIARITSNQYGFRIVCSCCEESASDSLLAASKMHQLHVLDWEGSQSPPERFD